MVAGDQRSHATQERGRLTDAKLDSRSERESVRTKLRRSGAASKKPRSDFDESFDPAAGSNYERRENTTSTKEGFFE
jgi:hypothetical protein